jgi:hypothetical protein
MRLIARQFPSALVRRPVIRALGVVLLACAIAGVGFAIGLRADAGEQPDPSGDVRALVEQSGSAVVYGEFGDSADTIWAANPSDPSARIALGTAPHAAGYSVFPSLSPDGKYVAYTAATSGTQAGLWLLDIGAGSSRQLASGIDLRSTPVWSNASDAVVVQRSSADESTPSAELLRVDLTDGVTTIASAAGGLYPIEFAPDGALYYASLSTSGTDLNVAVAGGSKTVAHLSDGFARDWDLSPDGKRLAYLAPRSAGGFAANVLDTATGESGGVASSSGPEFSPIWAPDGTLTVGRPGQLVVGEGAAAGSQGSGFDIPLSWSSDGAYLIVRHFEGASSADPGPSWLWSIDASGQRRKLSNISDVAIAGWLTK